MILNETVKANMRGVRKVQENLHLFWNGLIQYKPIIIFLYGAENVSSTFEEEEKRGNFNLFNKPIISCDGPLKNPFNIR